MKLKNLLLVLIVFGLSVAGLNVPNWTLSQDSYRPGANGVVTIEMSNPLVSGITDIKTIEAIDMDFIVPAQIIITPSQFVGDIEPGGSTKVSIPFKISPNAPNAIYTLEVKITGVSDRPEGYGSFDTISRRVVIPVTVVTEPAISLSTDKQRISGIENVQLTIVNNGGAASNVKVRIDEDSNVSLYGTTELYLPSVSGTVVTNISLDARDASDGIVSIPLIFEYEDEIGIKRGTNITLKMVVRNEPVDLTFTQQSVLITKNETTLLLSVRNSGTEELKDVRLSFRNSTIRLKDASELRFGDLAAGQSASASGVVYVDLPPGINLVETDVSWVEKDVQKEEVRKIPLTISSDANVGVYLEAKPLPLTLGSEHTISVLVSNLGSYAIENVDVSISSPAFRSMDVSDRQYIGGLQTDDFSTVQFSTKINATDEGAYPVYITINYRDQSGEWKQKLIVQDISVYVPQQVQQSPIPIILGIIVIAVLVWFFKLRKKG